MNAPVRASELVHQASGVSIDAARALIDDEAAILVDVRTLEERRTSGYIRQSLHIAWRLGAAQLKNPRFLKELSQQASADAYVLFICQSSQRSAEAAEAATKAGFRAAYVIEGMGGANGWRSRDLPWVET
jgi:rhodanese-related sulfurtransferase